MKQIILSEYQKNGASNVEAFIDSYLELRASGLSHEEIENTHKWVYANPYYEEDENGNSCDEPYLTIFVIEDVEKWFNERCADEKARWTNQDVLDVFEGKCQKKYGNKYPYKPVHIESVNTYKNVQYVQIQDLFFACETYLIKTEDGTVFSIWW